MWVCSNDDVGAEESSCRARFAALPLGRRKRSSFLGLRPEEVLLFTEVVEVLDLEVLIRELRVLVKARVVEEEISLPLVRLCGRGL